MEIDINLESRNKLKWFKYSNYDFGYIQRYEIVKQIHEGTYDEKTGSYLSTVLGTNLVEGKEVITLNNNSMVLSFYDFNLENYLDGMVDNTESEFRFSDGAIIDVLDSKNDVLYAATNSFQDEYYPSKHTDLFEKFAEFGKKLLDCICNLDNERFCFEIKDWLKNYGGLSDPKNCFIYSIIYKSVSAYYLDKIFKICVSVYDVDAEIKIKKSLKQIFDIEDEFISIKTDLEINRDITSDNPDKIEDYNAYLNFLDFSISKDSDFKALINDNSTDYYKKIAMLYMAKFTIKILEQYTISFYTDFPTEIKGILKDGMNESGYFIEISPKFTNLEQIIFNQFLQRLRYEPDKKICRYCKRKPIEPYIEYKNGKTRKTRFDKEFCGKNCQKQYLREGKK